jgi:hypothetical protein
MKFLDLLPSTALIETMLWTPEDGIFLKELHLQRLKNSAEALDFTMKNLEIIENSWEQAVEGRQSPQKIRSLSYKDGSLEVTAEPFENVSQKWRIVVSEYRLDSGDMLLRHKTTQRSLYNRERERIKGLADETIFLNERDEVCEGAITNIFVQSDDGVMWRFARNAARPFAGNGGGERGDFDTARSTQLSILCRECLAWLDHKQYTAVGLGKYFGMPQCTILYWRDIPAQVVVKQGRKTAKQQLPERFEQAIDRAAMKSGAKDSDSYLSEWRRGAPIEIDGDVDTILKDQVSHLETTFTKDKLIDLVNNEGRELV